MWSLPFSDVRQKNIFITFIILIIIIIIIIIMIIIIMIMIIIIATPFMHSVSGPPSFTVLKNKAQ